MTATAVSAEGISAAYGNRTLWTHLTLSVPEGSFLAVLGANGAGKTTLLRLLLGQLQPTSGALTVLGHAPRRGDQRVGYVPQQRGFDRNLPVRGVDLVGFGADGHSWGVGLPSSGRRKTVAAAIAAVGADEYAERPIGMLSGGEQQRLRLAQALVSNPRLLLADEPLLSLDVASQHQITGLLDERRRTAGTTVVMVTHDINPVLAYLDHVLYLTPDAAAFGAPDDVLTTETLTRLYRSPVDVIRVRGRVAIIGAPDDGEHHLDGGAHVH